MFTDDIVFRVRPAVDNSDMDRLRTEGFDHPVPGYDWASQLEQHSLTWICAYRRERLVGFVNIAWDGGVHAFLLDTAVALGLRRRGIGTRLVREAITAVQRHGGIDWIHVDSDEPLMSKFYGPAGFAPTSAGLVDVGAPPAPSTFEHSSVRRDGDLVVRSAGPWAPTVHALLRHLEDVGFGGAPRVVGSGFDADGNETLTYIEGDVHARGQRTVEAAGAVGSLLRDLHRATASFRPPRDAMWKRVTLRELGGGARVISHCDTGPWNIVLRNGLPHAFIDWDFAGPVDPRVEIAEAALLNANMYSDDIVELNELPSFDERLRQLRAFVVDGYGLSRADRSGMVDLMIEVLVHSMASNTWEAKVTPETKGSDALWSLTWKSRTAAWLLRNRRSLENALA